MADRLTGKVAVVTGAGSRGAGVGNGKAAAVLFAQEGASVLCVDLHAERAQETVDQILDNAAILLDEVGVDAFNANLLAERAEVAVRSVYR